MEACSQTLALGFVRLGPGTSLLPHMLTFLTMKGECAHTAGPRADGLTEGAGEALPPALYHV